jgi:hypothetical protein
VPAPTAKLGRCRMLPTSDAASRLSSTKEPIDPGVAPVFDPGFLNLRSVRSSSSLWRASLAAFSSAFSSWLRVFSS